MSGEKFYHWLGASADAETGSRADASSPQAVSTEGFDPARGIWSDYIEDLIDDAFATVSRNPSDHETAVAYRRAILWALQGGRAPNRTDPTEWR